MKVAAVLLHNNRLYRKVFDLGDEISFGSHKKDDVIVPDFTRQQIVIEYKKSGISLNAKEAYQITMKSVSMEKMILLNRQDQTCILFTQLTDRSSKSLSSCHGTETQYQRSLRNLPCGKYCLCASLGKMRFYSNLSWPWKLSGKRS